MRTTVAVVNQQGADFSFEEVELDAPRPDEVLVRIVATGLCRKNRKLPWCPLVSLFFLGRLIR